MPYFQMDDGFYSELAVEQAGVAAFGLYALCGDWVADKLTDGFVPREIANRFGTREWIERLVSSGLWMPTEGGYLMPDYLGKHGNWTREKVLAHRAAKAERDRRYLDAKKRKIAEARAAAAAEAAAARRVERRTDDASNGTANGTATDAVPAPPTPEQPPAHAAEQPPNPHVQALRNGLAAGREIWQHDPRAPRR